MRDHSGPARTMQSGKHLHRDQWPKDTQRESKIKALALEGA
jgi:hypothetical protein